MKDAMSTTVSASQRRGSGGPAVSVSAQLSCDAVTIALPPGTAGSVPD